MIAAALGCEIVRYLGGEFGPAFGAARLQNSCGFLSDLTRDYFDALHSTILVSIKSVIDEQTRKTVPPHYEV